MSPGLMSLALWIACSPASRSCPYQEGVTHVPIIHTTADQEIDWFSEWQELKTGKSWLHEDNSEEAK